MRAFAQKRCESRKETSSGIARRDAAAHATLHHVNPVLRLHRAIGNQAVRRLLQPKLTVGAPEDAYEREADRVAERVMRMPEARPKGNCSCGGSCVECRAGQTGRGHGPHEAITPLIQTKSVGGLPVGDSLAYSIGESRGGGSHLDDATRSDMESRFGADFSSVKVHTDGEAMRMNRSLNAHAFTVGSDIYFNGNYRPHSPEGKRLLAHELTHVLQQEGGRENHIQRWAVSGCTTPQEEYINDAVTRAYSDLSAVLPAVSARPVTEAVKDALWLAFRDDSDSTADLAKDNVGRLKDQITGTRFVCVNRESDRECRRGTLAYAPLGDRAGAVSICRPQFFDADMSVYAQSETVIHEGAHMYLSMEDRGYFAAPQNLCSETPRPSNTTDRGARDSGTAGDNPALRLENADSYGCLVHYLRYVPSQRRHDTASGYRGANLTIDSEDLLFTIYTRATAPRAHKFSVGGLPENSGFRFRWTLRAGGHLYNPSSNADGVDAGAFDERNDAVFVSTPLARLLWNGGVRQATLVCEIELFSPHADRFAPPVIIKEANVTVEDAEPSFN
jgi:hypothetical protein